MSGEAKDCVKGYLSLCTSNAYFAALETLKERFGSDFVVANAFRQKLRKWPRIQNDDFVGLRKFSDYLAQVETAKESNRSLSVLDDEQENRALLFKIPDFCHKGWAKQAARARVERRPYPDFSEFCKFIRYQSEIVNDPITCIRSSGSQSNSQNGSRFNQSQGTSQSNFGSRFQQQQGQSYRRTFSHAAFVPNSSQGSVSCFFCKQAHFMTNCQGFLALSPMDRRSFCHSEKLCFGCLRHGHSSRDCQRRLRCETCGRQHPTVLHDESYLSRQQSHQPP